MPKVLVHGNPECSAGWDLLVAELADVLFGENGKQLLDLLQIHRAQLRV